MIRKCGMSTIPGLAGWHVAFHAIFRWRRMSLFDGRVTLVALRPVVRSPIAGLVVRIMAGTAPQTVAALDTAGALRHLLHVADHL
jgi:hypothetical protein